MVRAWSLRTQNPAPLLGAVALAPALAVLAALSVRAAVRGPIPELLGILVVLVALEASVKALGLPRLLLARDGGRFVQRALAACAAGVVAAALAFVFLPALSPGFGALLAIGLGSALLLIAVRTVLPRVLGKGDLLAGVLVVGRGDLAAKICLDLLQGQQVERFAGVLDVGGRGGSILAPGRLQEIVRRERISRIIVAEPDEGARRDIATALLECRLLGVEVADAVEVYERRHGKLWLEALDPGRLVFADGFHLTRGYLRVKRLLDLVCALAVLVLAAPVWLVVALAVKLSSPGPVLFRQQRVGQFGHPFTLFKFRSMRVDAEADGPRWARENDGRATRVGRVLRRFHLDELPQVLNVLRDELSFVGPRPERPCFVEVLRERIALYDLRHYVKPGITGWAQVCYPYADSIEDSYEKLQYDLSYAQRVSLGLDCKILLRTAAKLLGGGGGR
jgi:exopolysaccharide biosynthesis polyprenyl glycosylphosphotransferase